ncbi:high affinity copper uptake protein 1 [Eupeodes corollae]|uniref:high affinity copper uptake protein 1 n=1 Tax=Eupeodes corollae TaxID=290404 RepID=UPI0024925E2B|nr:high affinity copper uptake protein 1 [Eupeodes corollae]XP_055913289.1 high affinity copper uptake protein 1 [Eupeodes corollae]XP_055913290.1 high affinity copper uptake protein 1 [Eupeodes corollae]
MDHSQHSIGNHDHMHHTETTQHNILHDLAVSTTGSPENVATTDHSMHQHHHHGGVTGVAMDHMMSMAFHFGCNETILFSGWKIETVFGLIGSMIAIFLMATLYEGLKYYREYLFWKTYNLLEYRPVSMPEKGPEEQSPAPTIHYVGEVIHKKPPSMLSINHLYQTLLHVIQVTLSFLLMLIFMTYNVWLAISVVLGAAVGYFLFCWKKSVIVDVTEHCH